MNACAAADAANDAAADHLDPADYLRSNILEAPPDGGDVAAVADVAAAKMERDDAATAGEKMEGALKGKGKKC